MEQEDEVKFNFTKYIGTLVRQWQWILICALGLGILGLVVSEFINLVWPNYRAVAMVSSAQTVSSVNFGSAITTQSQTDLASAAQNGAQALYDRTARLQSFVALVTNGDVANQVLTAVGSKLDVKDQSTAKLLEMIDAKLLSQTDTIQIGATYKDPKIAVDLANTWAAAYVQKINELYGASSSSTSYTATQQETVKAKTAYEAAQKVLDDFTAHNMIDEYNRQIQEITVVITSLRGARSTATSTIVNEEANAEQQVIDELYKAQATNQLLALQQDQSARRDLITAYINALSQGRQDVFNQQIQDRTARLDRAYSDRRQISLFIDDAVSMRAAVNSGGDAAANSNAVALTLLKAEVYAAFQGTNTLQIQQIPDTLGTTIGNVNSVGMVADLDALISTLQTRQTNLDTLINTLSNEIQNGTNLNVDSALESTGELAKNIQNRYPELFQIGQLSSQSINAIENGNPLASEAIQRSQALLQLKGLENVVNFSYANTPIENIIEENEQKIRDLQASISQETSTLTVLTRERDLDWTTYSALQTKSAELGVAAHTTGIEVVFSSPATPPDMKVIHPSIISIFSIIGGLLIGLIAAYAYEFWQNYRGRRIEILSKKVFIFVRHFRHSGSIKPLLANTKRGFSKRNKKNTE